MEFSTTLYKAGLGYSAINTVRSMLSSVISVDQFKTVGQWPLVKRFVNGVFNIKPSLPRYQRTWDVDTVLQYSKTLTRCSENTTKNLFPRNHMMTVIMLRY